MHAVRTFTRYYRIAGSFRGQNIRGFRGWNSDHEYFTHEKLHTIFTHLRQNYTQFFTVYLPYLQCKQQPRKYYPAQPRMFCPRNHRLYGIMLFNL